MREYISFDLFMVNWRIYSSEKNKLDEVEFKLNCKFRKSTHEMFYPLQLKISNYLFVNFYKLTN